MAKVKDIIENLEKLAPLETQEEWDNSGWQINLGNKETQKIMITLNVTEDTVNQAVKNHCDLIISHHPMIFHPIKCIKNKAIITAIQNNIQIYSSHTNFDKAKTGTTETLCEKLEKPLGLTTIKDLNGFIKTAKLKCPLNKKDFLEKIKSALKIKHIKLANPCNAINTVAICAGAGADFIPELTGKNIDCYISADIKYHQALDSKVMLADIGHFESEIISLQSLAKCINATAVEIVFSEEKSVFEIV